MDEERERRKDEIRKVGGTEERKEGRKEEREKVKKKRTHRREGKGIPPSLQIQTRDAERKGKKRCPFSTVVT